MIMIDQKRNLAAASEKAENRKGAVCLGIAVAIILLADTIVGWIV